MKINKIFYIAILIFGFVISAHTQNVINEEPDITRAMDYYKTLANSTDHINGWRIQLINTDNRRQMEAARAKFSSKYPYLKMTWEHVQPYYKVKVGAYKDKMELEAFLRELKADFPRAIPVRDKIYKSELSL
jgi:hypothetical protein